jgi:hypothetical protein
VQKVYDCDICTRRRNVTHSQRLSDTAKASIDVSTLSVLLLHYREREADVVRFSGTLLNLVDMTVFPYRLAHSKLTVSIGEWICAANPDIIIEILEDPQVRLDISINIGSSWTNLLCGGP